MPRFLSVDELSEYTGVAKQTIYNQRSMGKGLGALFPVIHPDGSRSKFVDADKVDEYMKSKEHEHKMMCSSIKLIEKRYENPGSSDVHCLELKCSQGFDFIEYDEGNDVLRIGIVGHIEANDFIRLIKSAEAMEKAMEVATCG